MVAPAIKHTFQSLKADGPDSTQIKPSNWNDVHTITLSQAALVGATASGPAVEVPISTNFQFTSGGLFDLSNAFATLINGAVQKSGGTMTGALTLAANPTNALDAAPKQYVDAAAVGTGFIAMWPLATVPGGYLECNGGNVSRTTYAALFAVIGTAYGVGDGSTTFGLPDFRGVFPRGWDHGKGTDAGRAIGTTQTDALQNVTGNVAAGGLVLIQSTSGASSGPFANDGVSAAGFAGGGGTGQFGVNRINFDLSRAARTSTETRPVNIALMFVIKT